MAPPNKLTQKTLDRFQKKGQPAVSQTRPSLSAWVTSTATSAAATATDDCESQTSMADHAAGTADWDAVVLQARTTLAGTRPGPRKETLAHLRTLASKRVLSMPFRKRRLPSRCTR